MKINIENEPYSLINMTDYFSLFLRLKEINDLEKKLKKEGENFHYIFLKTYQKNEYKVNKIYLISIEKLNLNIIEIKIKRSAFEPKSEKGIVVTKKSKKQLLKEVDSHKIFSNYKNIIKKIEDLENNLKYKQVTENF